MSAKETFKARGQIAANFNRSGYFFHAFNSMNSYNNSCFLDSDAEPACGRRQPTIITFCFRRLIFNSARHAWAGALCLLSTTTVALAGSAAPGKALEQGLQNGQAVWLDDGQGKYFSVFNPDQSGQPKGGVIILHDANSHPDKPEVVRPLRQRLPLHGWSTIAIQLPALDRPAAYLEQQAITDGRINGAVTYMRNSGFNNLVLLGHGSGAMAASKYLSSPSSEFIRAFVAISLGVLHGQQGDDSIPGQLERINLPILDIYGGNDLDHVTNSASERALAAKISSDSATRSNRLEPYKHSAIAKSSTQKSQGYISFRQIRIDGASHDFRGAEFMLTRRIIGWLERHAKGVAIDR